MPRAAKGARLWLEPQETDTSGKLVRRTTWVIRDGARKVRTGCPREDRAGAERALAEYISSKYKVPRERGRNPAQILVLDVSKHLPGRQGGQACAARGNQAAGLDPRRLLASVHVGGCEWGSLPRIRCMASWATLEISKAGTDRQRATACYRGRSAPRTRRPSRRNQPSPTGRALL